ncbi:MAG: hypothetical protein WAV95_03805 [Azonexus sp.]
MTRFSGGTAGTRGADKYHADNWYYQFVAIVQRSNCWSTIFYTAAKGHKYTWLKIYCSAQKLLAHKAIETASGHHHKDVKGEIA